MKPALAFLLAVAPQFLLVAGVALRAEYGRRTGVEVRLLVQPYDPMDPFAGRYLGTPLSIDRLDLTTIPHDDGLFDAGTVWVTLAPGPKHWTPVAVRRQRPDAPAGGVGLRAEVRSAPSDRQTDVLWLDYGLSRFYIPQDGKDPTTWRAADGQRPELLLVVRVAASGRAAVVDLLIDGVPYATWNR